MAFIDADAQVAGDSLSEDWRFVSAEKYETALAEMLCVLSNGRETAAWSRTATRMLRALHEMTAGYDEDPDGILDMRFTEPHADEIIVCRDIEFASLCEHHVLPFEGVAHVAYLPDNGRVVGLSKIARLVQCLARRLQLQERLTGQIAATFAKHLSPRGVAVIIEAQHACMRCRGVRSRGRFITSAMLGCFREGPTKLELLQLLKE